MATVWSFVLLLGSVVKAPIGGFVCPLSFSVLASFPGLVAGVQVRALGFSFSRLGPQNST